MQDSAPRGPLRRRTLLCAGASTTVALFAGCSGFLPGGGSGSDPDAGTDSYGISLENTLKQTHTVHVKVSRPFEDETIFEETVDIEGEETREWDEVITENEEWGVTASLPDAHSIDRWDSDNVWITPGSEQAPDVKNVRIFVSDEMLGDEPMPAIEVSKDPE